LLPFKKRPEHGETPTGDDRRLGALTADMDGDPTGVHENRSGCNNWNRADLQHERRLRSLGLQERGPQWGCGAMRWVVALLGPAG
jgi:hypothetical protein